MKKILLLSISICTLLVLGGCITYYERTVKFQQKVMAGEYTEAEALIKKDKFAKRERNYSLYLLNRGFLYRAQGLTDSSIHYFGRADTRIEDYRRKPADDALMLITNPMMTVYKTEDFENVFLHYYQALNYLEKNDTEGALVECRRMNIILNALNDKYKDNKPRYQKDAFAHVLMGSVYEAARDINNAFIAYRNAYEIYVSDYAVLFETAVPQQLKKDLVRTASLAGLSSEADFYSKKFGISFDKTQMAASEAVVFLEAAGPVKDEWSINLFATTQGGDLILENDELDLHFRYNMGGNSNLNDLTVLRVAFPKYRERYSPVTSATLNGGSTPANFEVAENINEIAFKSLRDRMTRELGNALLRLAVKKDGEIAISKQNETAGILVGIAGAVAEKADSTRNWQSLPHSIYYTRVPIAAGASEVTLSIKRSGGEMVERKIPITPNRKGLQIRSFHEL